MVNYRAKPLSKSIFLTFVMISVIVFPGCGLPAKTTKINQYSLIREKTPAPTNLNAIPGDGKVDLSWTAPGNTSVKEYEIWRWASGEVPKPLTTVSAATLTYVDTGLTNGTVYQYLVVCNAGSAKSSDVEALTFACPSPPAPVVEVANETSSYTSAENTGSESLPDTRGTFSWRSYENLVSLDQVACPRCGGLGQVPGSPNSVPWGEPPPQTCGICGGSGQMMRAVDMWGYVSYSRL